MSNNYFVIWRKSLPERGYLRLAKSGTCFWTAAKGATADPVVEILTIQANGCVARHHAISPSRRPAAGRGGQPSPTSLPGKFCGASRGGPPPAMGPGGRLASLRGFRLCAKATTAQLRLACGRAPCNHRPQRGRGKCRCEAGGGAWQAVGRVRNWWRLRWPLGLAG